MAEEKLPEEGSSKPITGQTGITAKDFNEGDFWKKLGRFAVKIGRPVVYQALCLYYSMENPAMPARVKISIMAALAYLVSPIDLVLDAIPIVGFADDAAVLAAAFAVARKYVTDEVKAKASAKIQSLMS